MEEVVYCMQCTALNLVKYVPILTSNATWPHEWLDFINPVCVSCSIMSNSATPRTVAHQAPLPMGFSRQEPWSGWSGLPFSSPEGLPDLGIEPWSLALQADSLRFDLQGSPLLSLKPTYAPYLKWFSSVHFNSAPQSCPTLCDPMNRSTPGLPVHHHLPEFTQTHVHRVCDAIQPSHLGSSPSPPTPNLSQHQSLFQWVNPSHEVAKVLELQL